MWPTHKKNGCQPLKLEKLTQNKSCVGLLWWLWWISVFLVWDFWTKWMTIWRRCFCDISYIASEETMNVKMNGEWCECCVERYVSDQFRNTVLGTVEGGGDGLRSNSVRIDVNDLFGNTVLETPRAVNPSEIRSLYFREPSVCLAVLKYTHKLCLRLRI